jgi:hypothetical protein
MPRPRSLLAALPLLASAAAIVAADYDPEMLKAKTRFAEREIRALNEPFAGIATRQGPVHDLFKVKPTGVSTAPLVAAAKAFLDLLTPTQQLRTIYAVDDPEWRRWCNVDNGIYSRQGVSLEEMTDAQKTAARELMRATLSAKGLALADAIRRTDETLAELNHDHRSYGEELYYFTVMGLPSATEPWGWQLDGHHLVINTFVLGDQVVMTPAFYGGEPIHTRTGRYAGNVLLQEEQDQGLALMRMFTTEQRAAATLSPEKSTSNIVAEAAKDNAVIDYAGLPVTRFTSEQKRHLLSLIALFVNNQSEGHARVRMEEVTAHLEETWFAWIGGADANAVFYYRIHSPVVLIEFDHQRPIGTTMINERGKPTREHIHVIIRTPNGNDYGKDLLRQHLATHPH